MASVTFRCTDELKDKLELEAKENNLSLSVHIVNKLLGTNTSIDINEVKPIDHVTRDEMNNLAKVLDSHKEAIDYYDNVLVKFIDHRPRLLQAFYDIDEDILLEWLRRLQDPKFNNVIGITPEVLGQRS